MVPLIRIQRLCRAARFMYELSEQVVHHLPNSDRWAPLSRRHTIVMHVRCKCRSLAVKHSAHVIISFRSDCYRYAKSEKGNSYPQASSTSFKGFYALYNSFGPPSSTHCSTRTQQNNSSSHLCLLCWRLRLVPST